MDTCLLYGYPMSRKVCLMLVELYIAEKICGKHILESVQWNKLVYIVRTLWTSNDILNALLDCMWPPLWLNNTRRNMIDTGCLSWKNCLFIGGMSLHVFIFVINLVSHWYTWYQSTWYHIVSKSYSRNLIVKIELYRLFSVY